jgi:hypothetical protein
MAAHTVYTEEIGKRIVAEIRTGLPVKFAAANAGVHRSTVYDWLERGEKATPTDADEPYVSFALLYRAAEAAYAKQELASIDGEVGEGRGDWKRTAWKLSKRFPGEFGDKLALEHSGPEGSPMQHEVTARVVVLPQITDAAVLADDPLVADAGAGALSLKPG